MKSVSEYRKAIVAGIGSATVLTNSALHEFAAFLPSNVSVVVSGVLAFGTAVATYLTVNAETIDSF